MFNNEGRAFMHKARVDCTIFIDVNKGHAKANGTCVVTDADRDKVFVEWNCAGVIPACSGIERSAGGTDGYIGISVDQKFQGNLMGDTGAGGSDCSGEYKLPSCSAHTEIPNSRGAVGFPAHFAPMSPPSPNRRAGRGAPDGVWVAGGRGSLGRKQSWGCACNGLK
jgi:hypothetical protein